MSTFEKVENKVATADGFHGGRRLRSGDVFRAPASMKGHWFTTAAADAKGVKAVLSEDFNVLDMSAAEVKELAPTLTSEQIALAISAETGSMKRKNVLALLRDETANRVGQTASPEGDDGLMD